ncbi:protein of unknown function (plasmid) [Pararobbsia alpina]
MPRADQARRARSLREQAATHAQRRTRVALLPQRTRNECGGPHASRREPSATQGRGPYRLVRTATLVSYSGKRGRRHRSSSSSGLNTRRDGDIHFLSQAVDVLAAAGRLDRSGGFHLNDIGNGLTTRRVRHFFDGSILAKP